MKKAIGALLVAIAVAGPLSAQVIDDVEVLDWDRPEAWAMKYFSSVSILTGDSGPPVSRESWTFSVGLELDTIPRLSEDQRRIGFGGSKVEDINRLPALFRPRVTVGLPAKISLDVAWVLPPVEVRGVESNLFAVALERPFFSSGSWTLGVSRLRSTRKGLRRFHMFGGRSRLSTRTPGQCLRLRGAVSGRTDPQLPRRRIHGRISVEEDPASLGSGGQLYGHGVSGERPDLLASSTEACCLPTAGHGRSATNGGASWRLGGRISPAAEIFYSPLSVIRPPSTSQDNDPLFNVRTMLRIDL